jgi:hypothetical protein
LQASEGVIINPLLMVLAIHVCLSRAEYADRTFPAFLESLGELSSLVAVLLDLTLVFINRSLVIILARGRWTTTRTAYMVDVKLLYTM